MGNCCARSSNEYMASTQEDENVMRQWEEKHLKAFEYTFQYLKKINSFNSNYEDPKKVSKFIKQHFTEDLVKIFTKNDFFMENNLVFIPKVQGLFFMISRSENTSEDISALDRAVFLFQEIMTNEEDILTGSIESHNPNLKMVLKCLVQITLAITLHYVEVNSLRGTLYLEDILKQDPNEIVDFMISNINVKQDDRFNFDDFNKKFANDKWFLSTGFIRESIYNMVTFNTNNPKNNDQK